MISKLTFCNMKRDWEYGTFADIMKPAKSERCGDRTDLPVLSITMHQGIIFQNERFKKVIASKDTKDYKIIKEGQLVIAFPIDEGLIYTQDIVKEGIMSPAYNVWDVDYSKLNKKFLNLYFHSPWAMSYYKSKLRGTTLRRRMIPKEDLLALPIPIPTIAEQEKIIAELDCLSLIIDKKKQQIEEYDNLAQSIFFEMFGNPAENDKGWDRKCIDGIFTFIKNGANIKQTKGASGIPITRIETLSGGIFNRDRLGYADIFSTEKYASNILDDGDLLFSHINSKTHIGRTVVYFKKDCETIIHGMNLLRMKVDFTIAHPIYINYFFKTNYFKDKIASYRKDAVNQSSISIGDLKKIIVNIPPIALQQEFAAKIAAIEKQKELIKKSIKEVENLLNSRMDYYFN